MGLDQSKGERNSNSVPSPVLDLNCCRQVSEKDVKNGSSAYSVSCIIDANHRKGKRI
jgi:hypothetical protein